MPVQAYGSTRGDAPLAPLSIERRAPRPDDIVIDIQYCGVCHSDLHTARGEWPGVVFPVVPGHEIVGKVASVGSAVKKFKVGDLAGVGCMVDSCRTCDACKSGLEIYCDRDATILTYNSPDRDFPGKTTYGGYSKRIVVPESFALHIPANLNLAATAPLLCAGITLYSPLKFWGAARGERVGIVGLGGLGHMGVKLAHAMGAETVLFTTSESKIADGKRLGADDVVVTKDPNNLTKYLNHFDLIVDTVSAPHNLDQYTTLLRRDGTLVLVGAPASPHPSPTIWPLLMKRRSIAGSAIGGIPETQEMLNFCGKHNITADIEMIRMDQINQAYERMLKSDVKYRFVIDISTL
jgi:uncharacterized zinc-type alcohol dehydrogenase-like protein